MIKDSEGGTEGIVLQRHIGKGAFGEVGPSQTGTHHAWCVQTCGRGHKPFNQIAMPWHVGVCS